MSDLNRLINKLPIELQLYIDEFYNEKKIYYKIFVLPKISFVNRIKTYYKPSEFVYLYHDYHRHYLINVNSIIQNMSHDMMQEIEFPNSIILNQNNIIIKKNVWLRIHITEMLNYFAGMTQRITQIIYINKYNFKQFAVKTFHHNFTKHIYIFEPSAQINMQNYCNYYYSQYFQHLPQNAIDQLELLMDI